MRWCDWTGILGLVLIVFGGVSLWLDLDPWHILWYVFVWFGYFLTLDAVLARCWDRGVLILHQKHLGMFLWSIPFWFFFELYNIRIQNWYYVFTFHSTPASFFFSCLAFSTVLPICLLHGEILTKTALFRNISLSPLPVRGLRNGLAIFGVCCLLLPLIVPRYAFWMTWGALACLPEVLAYRVGSPSILSELERGNPRRLCALIVGGAWAGLLWEGLNFGARCKWIYTVPGLEGAKLFEMPLLGFVGFPALALNAYPTYGLIRKMWDTRGAAWLRPLLTGVGVVVVLWGFIEMRSHTVHSKRPLMEDVDGLTEVAIISLTNTGVATPEALVTHCVTESTRDLAESLHLSTDDVDLACRHAGLSIHKGLGTTRARLLMDHGVRSVEDLPLLEEQSFADRIVSAGSTLQPPISKAEVGVWYRAARSGAPRR